MRIIYIMFFVFTVNITLSQTKEIYKSSLKNSIQIDEMEKDLTNSVVNVKVIETCSTNPNLCGNMAFGSTSLVKILDGKYQNQILNISILCKETNYAIDKIYLLKVLESPKFGVGICNNEVYHVDRAKYIEEKRLPMLFGILE